MPNRQNVTVDVSVLTIIKIIGVFLVLGFLYLIRDVLVLLFVALIFTAAISPWIDWWEKKKVSRSLAVLFTYVVLLGSLALIIYLIIPPVIEQINQFSAHFPSYYQKISGIITFLPQIQGDQSLINNFQEVLGSWGGAMEKATSSIFSTLTGFFGGLISFVIVLVITFYMTATKNGTQKFFQSVAVPLKYQPYLTELTGRMQKKMGGWLKGQLILSLVIGTLIYVGLLILGVKFALVLSLLAAFTEIIPYIGPLIGGILAVFVAFVQAPFLALPVAILYIVVQQLENHIIVPRVMKKTVGLNPIAVIISIIAGGKLGGVVGALIAIPVVTALSVLLKDFFEIRREQNNRTESGIANN